MCYSVYGPEVFKLVILCRMLLDDSYGIHTHTHTHTILGNLANRLVSEIDDRF